MFKRNNFYGLRFVIAICTALLLCSGPLSAAASAADTVGIELDGKTAKLADPARLVNGSIFVPVASLSTLLGADMKWNNTNEEATIHTALGDTIVLGNGVPVVYFNDGRYVMDSVPFVEEGRMYVPLRETAEMMHARVSWNDKAGTAEIKTVQPAVAADDYGLAEISKDYGMSQAQLLARNGLAGGDSIKPGKKLKVVIPYVQMNKAKPFTEEELTLLAKITQVEAGYEPYEGQLGIANVILNRVKDSRFPDTIKDVIYSGKQFPPAHNGLLDKSKPGETALRAAKDALNGKNNVGDAVYFFNPEVSKGEFWSSLDVVVTIGHHSFAK
ncbi:cell wall hydrolase [Paenibacillus thailandensis]|uniref:Cell wall hydrolase n=1 Tax=Paenibacillus thailandensis TaxID=393250 RepID=A0ABW5QWU3_9BACL